jgi:hypothetical protein
MNGGQKSGSAFGFQKLHSYNNTDSGMDEKKVIYHYFTAYALIVIFKS